MQPPRDESSDRRDTWKGFNDGLAQGIEMSVTPVLFSLLGLLLDRWLGTLPIFAIVFLVLAVTGTFAKAYFVYKHQMEQFETRRPWVKPSR